MFILQKGYTVDVQEYYDYPNNRGMVRRTKAGSSSTWLYDFRDYVSFLIVGTSDIFIIIIYNKNLFLTAYCCCDYYYYYYYLQ